MATTMNANCSVMAELSGSRFLNISLIYNLLVACIGLPIFTWASTKLWADSSLRRFNVNLRVLAQMHLFGFILHCYGRVVLHSLDLYNYHFREPCDMIPDVYRCFIFRLCYNTGMWLTTCTAFTLALERSIATYRRDIYEKSNACLGLFLCVIQVLIASVPLLLAYSNTRFDGVFMPYCSVYKPGHPEIAQINAVASIVAQAAARGLFGYLFYVNKKFRDDMKETELSTRFQLQENKISNQCLKIYANTSTVFLLIQSLSFTALIRNSSELQQKHYLALMELNCQYPLYGIISVVLVAKRLHSINLQINTEFVAQAKMDLKEEGNLYHDNFRKQIDALPLGEKARKS